jgi:hypothetical protein
MSSVALADHYLTTGKGEPLPQVRFFGFSTSWTKKMLNSRLRKITGGRNIDHATPTEIQEAGQQTLQYLLDHCKEHQRAKLIAQQESGALEGRHGR